MENNGGDRKTRALILTTQNALDELESITGQRWGEPRGEPTTVSAVVSVEQAEAIRSAEAADPHFRPVLLMLLAARAAYDKGFDDGKRDERSEHDETDGWD